MQNKLLQITYLLILILNLINFVFHCFGCCDGELGFLRFGVWTELVEFEQNLVNFQSK